MNTTSSHLGRLIILALALCLTTACCEKNDDDGPATPTTPTGNKFTVSATGGTVEMGDIAIEVTTGTFENEATVYLDKVEAGTVFSADAEASDFYKLTLPATTSKPLRVSVKSDRATDDCVMMVRAAGRATSGGEQLDYCVPLEEGKAANGVFSAEMPVLEGGEGNAEVTIGLLDCKAAQTRVATGDEYLEVGNTEFAVSLPYARRTINVKATDQTLLYRADKFQMLTSKFIPQALQKLDSLGFRLDEDRESIPIQMVTYFSEAKRTGLWGQHICSKLSKHWDCVQINSDKLFNMSTQEEQEELAKTLVHELGHYFQSDYDMRRGQYMKAISSPGAYLALMEASSVWTEHYFGSPLSSIVVDNGMDFLSAGLWNCSDDKYDTHGYGMSVLFTYLAQQYGDLSIISIFDSYKAGKEADVCLSDYAKAHNFRIDDIEWYNEFLRATAEGRVIAGYDMGGQSSSPWKVNNDNPQVKNLTINRYGMGVRSLYMLAGTNIESKQLTLSESEEGTYTEVYRADYHISNTPGVLSTVSNLSYLGRVDKNASLVVTDSLDKLFKQQRLFFVTLQDPTVSHKVSAQSTLQYQLSDPPPTLSLGVHELQFDANGGEQTVSVTTNQETIRVSTTADWLDATYDAENKQIIVKAEKNAEDLREAYVVARVQNSAGNEEQTILVTQGKQQGFGYGNISRACVRFNAGKMVADGASAQPLGGFIPRQETVPLEGTCTDQGNLVFTAHNSSVDNPSHPKKGDDWSFTIFLDKDLNMIVDGHVNYTWYLKSYAHSTDAAPMISYYYTVSFDIGRLPFCDTWTFGNTWIGDDGYAYRYKMAHTKDATLEAEPFYTSEQLYPYIRNLKYTVRREDNSSTWTEDVFEYHVADDDGWFIEVSIVP